MTSQNAPNGVNKCGTTPVVCKRREGDEREEEGRSSEGIRTVDNKNDLLKKK
jgi:hypothetical protein